MKLMTLNNVKIKTDLENRYCLNDLHKAAMNQGKATKQQRPSSFLRNDSIKKFVQCLSDAQNSASVVIMKGGTDQGTYAHELIVLRYAAWLDTEFEIFVYNAFKEIILNKVSWMSKLNALDKTIESERLTVSSCARTMRNWGVGGRKQQLHNEREQLAEQSQIKLAIN